MDGTPAFRQSPPISLTQSPSAKPLQIEKNSEAGELSRRDYPHTPAMEKVLGIFSMLFKCEIKKLRVEVYCESYDPHKKMGLGEAQAVVLWIEQLPVGMTADEIGMQFLREMHIELTCSLPCMFGKNFQGTPCIIFEPDQLCRFQNKLGELHMQLIKESGQSQEERIRRLETRKANYQEVSLNGLNAGKYLKKHLDESKRLESHLKLKVDLVVLYEAMYAAFGQAKADPEFEQRVLGNNFNPQKFEKMYRETGEVIQLKDEAERKSCVLLYLNQDPKYQSKVESIFKFTHPDLMSQKKDSLMYVCKCLFNTELAKDVEAAIHYGYEWMMQCLDPYYEAAGNIVKLIRILCDYPEGKISYEVRFMFFNNGQSRGAVKVISIKLESPDMGENPVFNRASDFNLFLDKKLSPLLTVSGFDSVVHERTSYRPLQIHRNVRGQNEYREFYCEIKAAPLREKHLTQPLFATLCAEDKKQLQQMSDDMKQEPAQEETIRTLIRMLDLYLLVQSYAFQKSGSSDEPEQVALTSGKAFSDCKVGSLGGFIDFVSVEFFGALQKIFGTNEEKAQTMKNWFIAYCAKQAGEQVDSSKRNWYVGLIRIVDACYDAFCAGKKRKAIAPESELRSRLISQSTEQPKNQPVRQTPGQPAAIPPASSSLFSEWSTQFSNWFK